MIRSWRLLAPAAPGTVSNAATAAHRRTVRDVIRLMVERDYKTGRAVGVAVRAIDAARGSPATAADGHS
jgi:hypothetical protein